MSKITIELNNNKCKLTGDRRVLSQLYDIYGIKHPSAFHISRYMPRGWDRKIHYITEAGYFSTGLLEGVISEIKKLGHRYQIIDSRLDIPKGKIPKKVGNITLRDYQTEALSSVIKHNIDGLPFHIGVLDAATNAGKTAMSAGIFQAYGCEYKTIMLINDADLYNQFKKEIPELVGKHYGYVRGKEIKWNNFTVAMVQTLAKDISRFKHELAKFQIVIVDEADLADNKTYKKVIENLYNSWCRVGLSVSIYVSKYKKDETKNMNLKKFFGEVLFSISKQEMISRKLSSNITVRIYQGNTIEEKSPDYRFVYDKCISNNKARNDKALLRLKKNIKVKRLPALVVCKFKHHTEHFYDAVLKGFPQLKVEYVHSGVPDKKRKSIMNDFREGHIDILVSSLLIKRGKNFPRLKYILNISSGDSEESVIQLLGRGERLSEFKQRTRYEDFYDKGRYLERHSKHRINYIKKQGFKVKIYKK